MTSSQPRLLPPVREHPVAGTDGYATDKQYLGEGIKEYLEEYFEEYLDLILI